MTLTSDRKSNLIAAATAYFNGLATKDFASVPWAETIVFRGPLSPGGAESPLVGRDSVLAFFNALGPNLGEVRIVGHFLNEDLTAIVTKAEVSVLEPTCVLRVADLFEVDAEGRITAQENHYDPRPALG
ncbi:MAG: nuclear transport factor 2 family protein [Bryobacteraceae bacterium]|nr:nuclear transport factor 2 family protein [Bryobacteraceae bacterium]